MLLRRQGFKYVVEAVDQLVSVLKTIGPERAIDMDDAVQRAALEVILHAKASTPYMQCSSLTVTANRSNRFKNPQTLAISFRPSTNNT